jgi:hypothetical protein
LLLFAVTAKPRTKYPGNAAAGPLCSRKVSLSPQFNLHKA